MDGTPAWKEAFPVSWVDDHYVTRRDFARSLSLVSCAAFAANAALVALDAAERGAPPPEPRRIAAWGDLEVGASRVFEFRGPCLLVRLAEDRYVAFSQRCTHLGCPVVFRKERRDLQCPCHEGYFSAEDGRVLSGPPPRPLPVISLERRGDELWATGIRT
jgi:Rieske Fe-S protein